LITHLSRFIDEAKKDVSCSLLISLKMSEIVGLSSSQGFTIEFHQFFFEVSTEKEVIWNEVLGYRLDAASPGSWMPRYIPETFSNCEDVRCPDRSPNLSTSFCGCALLGGQSNSA
jgi:hypothetical protein